MSEQYHGNDITTVSDIQRQFNEMEVLSNSMANNNSFIGSPRNSLKSIKESEEDQESSDQQQENSYQPQIRELQIRGGSTKSVISGNSNSDGLTKQSFKKAGIVVPSTPLSASWPFGDAMFKSTSGQVKSTIASLELIGCTVCQGFGHSKSNCITQKKLKQISLGGPLYSVAIKKAFASVQLLLKQGKKIDGRWFYGDNIKTCAVEWLSLFSQNMQANIGIQVQSLSQEIDGLSETRCLYCNGYGHIQSDYIDEKITKQEFLAEKKRIKKRKYAYRRVEVYCETKQEFELSLRGFQTARLEFVKLLADFRNTQVNKRGATQSIENFRELNEFYKASKPDIQQVGASDTSSTKIVKQTLAEFIEAQKTQQAIFSSTISKLDSAGNNSAVQIQAKKQEERISQILDNNRPLDNSRGNQNYSSSRTNVDEQDLRDLNDLLGENNVDASSQSVKPIQMIQATQEIQQTQAAQPISSTKIDEMRTAIKTGKTKLQSILKKTAFITIDSYNGLALTEQVNEWGCSNFPKSQPFNGIPLNQAQTTPSQTQSLNNLAAFMRSNLDICVKTCIFVNQDAFLQAYTWATNMSTKYGDGPYSQSTFMKWPSRDSFVAMPKQSVCKISQMSSIAEVVSDMIARTNHHLQSVKLSLPKRGPMTIDQISSYLAALVKMIIFLGQEVIQHSSENQTSLEQLIQKSDQILKEKCDENSNLKTSQCLEQFEMMSNEFKILKSEISAKFKNVMDEKVELFKGIKLQHTQVEDSVKKYLKQIAGQLKEQQEINKEFLVKLNKEFDQFKESLKLVRSKAQTEILKPLTDGEVAIHQINTLKVQIDEVVKQLRDAAIKLGEARAEADLQIQKQNQMITDTAEQMLRGTKQINYQVDEVSNKVAGLQQTIQSASDIVQTNTGQSVKKIDNLLGSTLKQSENIQVSVQKTSEKLKQLDERILKTEQAQSSAVEKTAQVSKQIDSVTKQIQTANDKVKESMNQAKALIIKSESQQSTQATLLALNIDELQKSIAQIDKKKADFNQMYQQTSQMSINLVQNASDALKTIIQEGLEAVTIRRNSLLEDLNRFDQNTNMRFNSQLELSKTIFTKFLKEIDEGTIELTRLLKEQSINRQQLQTNVNSTQLQKEILVAVENAIQQKTAPIQQILEQISQMSERNQKDTEQLEKLNREINVSNSNLTKLTIEIQQKENRLKQEELKLEKSRQVIKIAEEAEKKLQKHQLAQIKQEHDNLVIQVTQKQQLLSELSFQASDAQKKAEMALSAIGDMQTAHAEAMEKNRIDSQVMTAAITTQIVTKRKLDVGIEKNKETIKQQLEEIKQRDEQLEEKRQSLKQLGDTIIEKTKLINEHTAQIENSQHKLANEMKSLEQAKKEVAQQLRYKQESLKAEQQYKQHLEVLKEEIQAKDPDIRRKRDFKTIDSSKPTQKIRTSKPQTQSVQIQSKTPQLNSLNDSDNEDVVQPQTKRNNYVGQILQEETKENPGNKPAIVIQSGVGTHKYRDDKYDSLVDDLAIYGVGAIAITAGGAVIYKFRQKIKDFLFD